MTQPDTRNETATRGLEATLPQLLEMRGAAQGLCAAPPRVAHAPLAGPYRSAYRGRGVDFEEVRAYQPGDDVRNIDWRVTARTGGVYSKIFHEERERPVWLLVDLGTSMRFGTRSRFKSVAAARLAALLAWLSRLQGDRLGAVVRSPRGLWERDPQSSEAAIFEVFHALVRESRLDTAGEEPSLARAILGMRARLRAGSRVFVLSDFYGLDAPAERGLAALAAAADLACVSIYDALEAHAPPPARYQVSDGRAVRAFSTRAAGARAAYEQDFADRQDRLRALCRKQRAELVALRTDASAAEAVAPLLRPRRAPSGTRRAA